MDPILRRWKHVGTLITVAALAVYGCADISTNPAPATSIVVRQAIAKQRLLDMRRKHGAIGRYHSDGLAFVLESLKKSNARRLSRDGRCQLAEKAAREFHVAVRRLKLPPGTPSDDMISSFCQARSASAAKGTIVADPLQFSKRRQDLSPAAIGYLEQIETLMNTAQSVDQLRASAYAIEGSAVSTLDDAEAGEIVEVISVLNSSADYWQENQAAWEDELGGVRPVAYAVSQTFGKVRSSIQGQPIGRPRHGVGFRDYLRVVRADVLGAMGSPHGILSYCPVLACRAYDSLVASMREALAPQ